MEVDFDEIKKLNDGKCYTIPESDYGKAEVWKINNLFIVFLIPVFGGEPMYQDQYFFNQKNIDSVIKDLLTVIYSYT